MQNLGHPPRESDEETFQPFLQNVKPLMNGHPELNFDVSLSFWLNHAVYKKYTDWKSSPAGIDKPKEIQVVYLLKLWKSVVGKEANARNSISRIENKSGTKNFVEKIKTA